ncbi:MAG: hypothetical protein AAFP97_12475 [Pseudomonadota bacterium]
MVLKFIVAGLISALLAGAAIFLLLDDATVDRIRAEREALRTSEVFTRSGVDGARGAEMIDRLLGRDVEGSVGQTEDTVSNEAEPVEEVQNPDTDDLEDGRAPDSRVGRQVVEEGAEEAEPRRGWLDSYLPDRDAVDQPTKIVVPPVMFETLLDQAALIKIDDARDDAYLNILDYALREDRMGVAETLIEKLSTPPLRDTARQRIGVAHAQAGRVDAAFAAIEGVEIAELADPIRLEIIRAITAE